MEDDPHIGFYLRVKQFFKFFFWSIGLTDLWNKAGEELNSDKKDTN